MTRKEVRDFLEEGVNELTPALDFGSGRVSDFDPVSAKSGGFPRVWQVIAPVSSEQPAQAPLDNWNIDLLIAGKDSMDSIPEQYELIIDDCDEIAQKLIYKYRNIVDGFKLVTMTGVNRDPFVKMYGAAVMSGVRVTFTLIAPDQTNVC